MRSYVLAAVALMPLAFAKPHAALLSDQKPLIEDDTGLPMMSAGIAKESLDDIIADSELLSLHRSLCEIKSISNHEENVGGFLIDYLEQRGFTVEKQYVPQDGDEDSDDNRPGKRLTRFNIYAYPSSSPTPKIILSSHIDTVPPFIPYSLHIPASNLTDPIDPRTIHIAGRGTVDAKGSVAAQIIAVLSHLKAHPETPLGLLFVVSEETGGNGMLHFSDSSLNTSPPTFHTVIFGEPTEGKLVSGHKGMLHFTVNVGGKPAHSGYPWLGRSAVSEILPILSKIDKLGDIPESEGGLPSSKKYGRTTLNIGVMEGGVATNVVPATAYASVAVRLAGGSIPHAKKTVLEAVRSTATHPEHVEVDFSGGGAYGPVDLDTDVDGFDIMTVNYGTDVPNLIIHDHDLPKGEKVKRYLYGPGSIFVAHGENEGLSVGELEDAVEGYGRLIKAAVKRKA